MSLLRNLRGKSGGSGLCMRPRKKGMSILYELGTGCVCCEGNHTKIIQMHSTVYVYFCTSNSDKGASL